MILYLLVPTSTNSTGALKTTLIGETDRLELYDLNADKPASSWQYRRSALYKRGGLLLVSTITLYDCGGGPLVKPVVPLTTPVFNPLQQDLQKSYLDLFQLAPTLEYSSAQIDTMCDNLKSSGKMRSSS